MLPMIAYYSSGQDWLIIGALVIPLVASVFWVIALVDAVRRQFNEPNLKIIWILVILFGHLLGVIAYYLVGKKQGVLPSN